MVLELILVTGIGFNTGYWYRDHSLYLQIASILIPVMYYLYQSYCTLLVSVLAPLPPTGFGLNAITSH